MSKKTALRIACEKLCDTYHDVLESCMRFNDCKIIGCPVYKECEKYTTEAHINYTLDHNVQIDILEQYFQQQADIPDGWEVVKELYKQLKIAKADAEK